MAVLLLAGSILASLLLTQYNFSDDAVFWTRIVGAISILVLLFNYLLRPVLNPPTRRQIARFLEERHPELQERLSTAVELEKAGSPVRKGKSVQTEPGEDVRIMSRPAPRPASMTAGSPSPKLARTRASGFASTFQYPKYWVVRRVVL